MVSQFVSSHVVGLLGDLAFEFPEGTHAVGRLDNDSEGLLLLTTNKKVTRLLFEGVEPHRRAYLVQVKYVVSEETAERLRRGVTFLVKGGMDYVSTACSVLIVEDPSLYIRFWPSVLPQYPPYSWLLITLTEGKYHQVRKMVAAVGHKCLRLIRVSIEELALGDLQPGEVRELDEVEFFERLKIG